MNQRLEQWLAAFRDPLAFTDLVLAGILAAGAVFLLALPIYVLGAFTSVLVQDIAVLVAVLEFVPAWVLVFRALRKRGRA